MKSTISLRQKRFWIFPMTASGAEVLASAWRSLGLEAEVIPPSDDETLALGSRHATGDECLPQKITMGDLLKLAKRPDYSPDRDMVFFPSTNGPCRFGQYVSVFKKVFRDEGLGDLQVVSPLAEDGYQSLGEEFPHLARIFWWGVVGSDLLRKALHRIRPYEVEPGATDKVHSEARISFCRAMEQGGASLKGRLAALAGSLHEAARSFARIPVRSEARPLIGVVGEIFCRLHPFSNQDLIRRLERAGGEAWLSDVSEWVWYCNDFEERDLRREGRRLSFAMLGAKVRDFVQRSDEHLLWEPFKALLRGREEPESPAELLEYAEPYLPCDGAMGEMLLSLGKTVYLEKHGAHGVIDISPFTCMNGIVSEALYPRLSSDLDGFPIKNFYFDGKPAPLDRDLEIFLELAKGYRARAERVRG